MTHQIAERPSILRRSSLLAVATVASAAGQFLPVWYMARYRGVTFLGAYGAAITLVDIASVIYTSGVQPLVMQKAARRPKLSGALVGTALMGALSLSLASTVLVALLPIALGYTSDVVTATSIAALMLMPEGIRRTGELIAIGSGREKYVTLITLCTATAQTTAAMAALVAGGQLVHVLGIIVISTVSCAGIYLWLLSRWIQPQRIRTSPRMLLAWTRLWWPLFWMGALGIASFRLDLPILTRLAGLEAGGIYTAALKALKPLVLLRPAVFKGFFPEFAYLFNVNRSRSLDVMNNTVSLLTVTLSATALVAVGVAAPIIAWIYGPAFAATATALRIMVWGLPTFYVYTIAASTLLANGQEKAVLRIHVINLAAEIILSLVVVPLFGATGMAAIYSLVRILGAIQLWLVLRKEHTQIRLGKALWSPLLTAAAMSCPLLLTQGLHPSAQIVAGILAGVLYGVIALVAGFITKQSLAPLLRKLGGCRGLS